MIRAINETSEERIIQRLANTLPDTLHTAIINHIELLFGVFNSTRKTQNLEKVRAFPGKIPILPFCETSACLFAQNKAKLKTQGSTLTDLDLMIASISVQNEMTLVTTTRNILSAAKA